LARIANSNVLLFNFHGEEKGVGSNPTVSKKRAF
jgi:hypothetical protein